ncbi:IclR family transcriptional regulator [Novosphingobium sp.]|uniref:IclR family transcriptional regulator n=1 Tax=Novosphingobium sp. TaxID=1874826 RepID=UPI00286DCA35|nr:IclR family transcriptional regulator [Novosphingobium sp.]
MFDMAIMENITDPFETLEPDARVGVKGAQTLMRALDILDEVIAGPIKAVDIARKLGMSKTTAHRLAHALKSREYLSITPDGFALGPKLLQLGAHAESQTDFVRLARPVLESLSSETGFCSFAGQREGDWSRHLDRVNGRQRLRVATIPGDVRPIAETGLGKALLLDEGEETLRRLYAASRNGRVTEAEMQRWIEKMRDAKARQLVDHDSELGDGVHSIAAPVRNAKGKIVMAISIAGAAQYYAETDVAKLCAEVSKSARSISALTGYVA